MVNPTIMIANPDLVKQLLDERHGRVGFFEAMTMSSEFWAERDRLRGVIEAELLALGQK